MPNTDAQKNQEKDQQPENSAHQQGQAKEGDQPGGFANDMIDKAQESVQGGNQPGMLNKGIDKAQESGMVTKIIRMVKNKLMGSR